MDFLERTGLDAEQPPYNGRYNRMAAGSLVLSIASDATALYALCRGHYAAAIMLKTLGAGLMVPAGIFKLTDCVERMCSYDGR